MSEVNAVKRAKIKRDIFRFDGEVPTAINLEHVTTMSVQDKKITFNFASNAIFIEMDTKEAAQTAFEQLLSVWSTDIELKPVDSAPKE